ncbi:helix-turn-helix domain-containing protein [Phyllobacterium chamaecytisi]|uniref:helix-turn-helix domain-containing protein n=1 Tax=Phyllobacterium chamaecytisi TaxID=2876082 RepID=UPI001CCA1546|nr:helix-turn-helix domain-containing protein [Phyllobacterium sp. KW56]MBZ9603997.1 DNA-packaging protein [Phyllobacterium sp. KW56]
MTKPVNKGGRPTDYKPTYGDEILSMMAEGFSLTAAASVLGIHRQRVYEWVERYDEFADTIKLAQAKRQHFLENRLLTADSSPVVVSTIFALKNAAAADWRDKQEVEHTGDQVVTFTTVYDSK